MRAIKANRKLRSGQASIEMAVAIVALFIFFIGTLHIFKWLSSMIVNRQGYYESTRASAASREGGGTGTYEYNTAPLDIFAGGGE